LLFVAVFRRMSGALEGGLSSINVHAFALASRCSARPSPLWRD